MLSTSVNTEPTQPPPTQPQEHGSTHGESAAPAAAALHSDEPSERLELLHHAIEHAAHYLPAQAPLEVFVHHNTLHAFQHLPFHDAVDSACRKLGARGYLSEDRYRAALQTGRITTSDLQAVLKELPVPSAWPTTTKGLPSPAELQQLILLHGLPAMTAASLKWQLTEGLAETQLRKDLPATTRSRILASPAEIRMTISEATAVRRLWAACQQATASLPRTTEAPPRHPQFPRDLLFGVGNEDPNELVHPVLIPLCAAFLDRGQSSWAMPDREEGFFVAWRRVLAAGHAVRPAWEADLGKRVRKAERQHEDAAHAVLDVLDELGIANHELADFVEHTLLLLPGWAGLFRRMEGAPGPTGRSHPKIMLIDFLAVRMWLDVLAYRDLGKQLGHHGPLRELRSFLRKQPLLTPILPHGEHDTAWPLFQVAQLAGISATTLQSFEPTLVQALLQLINQLTEHTRLRIWHNAYERHYRDEVLVALADNRSHRTTLQQRQFQVMVCMDDREESLRRHIEEISPQTETFGAAGFFGLAIAFQGIDDPSTFPLCPVVLQPQHRIIEQPAEHELHLLDRRRRWRQRWGRLDGLFTRASRSLLWGPLITAVSGLWTSIPLLGHVFAPRLMARIRRRVQQRLLPDVKTSLTPPREAEGGATPTVATDALMSGFSIEEKATRVATLLENIGLVRDFAPLVAILGHDSQSANNPHFAAYSCGACGGRSGGPNARLFARMANRPGVRQRLRERGIHIPDSTVFVGGVHNTCADAVTLYDEAVPPERLGEVAALRQLLSDALKRNAHERSRRFASAPAKMSWLQALHHVEERAADLSQARPELGHATNAACIVGRRSLSRGVFLDRRIFLVSYDPTVDQTGSILERILLAVGPVGAGINLEYFFSTVDNERLGAGTKLPHNVTGLVGVMNGACSDLRTGLPKQMIEIHEPVRLQLMIESRPEVLAQIVERQPAIAELVRHEWLCVTTIDPDTGAMMAFDPTRGFEPWQPRPDASTQVPVVQTWVDWYQGKQEFVPPARIAPPTTATKARS